MNNTVVYKDLSKYLPFLDYVVDKTDYVYREKFETIRTWIASKKKFAEAYFKKMEDAMAMPYKELNKQKGFPPELHKIFVETVDLCSDDDDDVQLAENPPSKITSKPTNDDAPLIKNGKTLSAAKPLTKASDVVLILSDDEDDANEARSINQKHENSHSPTDKEILDRISKTVKVAVNNNKDEQYISPLRSPPPFSPKESATAQPASLPLDEDNKPIFYRRSDLPNLPSTSNETYDLEPTSEASTSKKKKKKRKKDKKEKKLKKEKHHKEKESKEKYKDEMDSIPTELPFEDMDASLLLKIKEKILEGIEKISPEKPETKPIEEELNEKTADELLAIGHELIENMGIRSEKDADSILSSFSTDVPRQTTIPTVAVEQHEIPIFELGPKDNLVPEKTQNNIVQPNTQPQQNSIQINGNLPHLPISIKSPVQTATQFIPSLNLSSPVPLSVTPQFPAAMTPMYPQQGPPLPSGPIPITETPPLPLHPVPISNQYVPPLPTVSTLPVPSSQPAMPNRSNFKNPSPPLPNNAVKANDPRIKKLLTEGQYCDNISFGSSLPQIPNGSFAKTANTALPGAVPPMVQFPLSIGQYGNNTFPATQSAVTGKTLTQWPDPQYAQNRLHPIPGSLPHKQTQILQWHNSSFSVAPPLEKRARFTKSPETYGSYKRSREQDETSSKEEEKRKQEEEKRKQEEEKRKQEEEKRKKEEAMRLKKLKDEEEAKICEEQENRRCTENIRNILYKHKEDISKMQGLQHSSVPEKRRQSLGLNKTGNSDLIEKSLSAVANSAPKKIVQRRKTVSSSRIFKELECTVKGYSNMQDFVPTTIEGKRRCSLSARKAIAENLSLMSEDIEEEEIVTTPRKRRARKLSSSSSEGSVKSKRQKMVKSPAHNELPKMKPCRVVITKLSKSEILKYTRPKSDAVCTFSTTNLIAPTANATPENYPNSPLHKMQVKPADTKPTPKVVLKNASQPLVIKNIDCRMTERNCKVCALCKKGSRMLTNHYIQVHKTESYVSRLTWEELDDLILNVPAAEEVTNESGDSRIQQYKVVCPFCPPEHSTITASFPNLRRHYSSHTGEYAYSCKGCGLQKPIRDTIKMHQQHKKCDGSGIQTLYQYPSDQLVINTYLCNICNFVQLNDENVYKHLREQHGQLKKDPTYVRELTLAAIKDGQVTRAPLSTLPNIMQAESLNHLQDCIEAAEKSSDNEEVLVSNEPLLEDSIAGTIKCEPGFQQNYENDLEQIANMGDEDEFVPIDKSNNGVETSTIAYSSNILTEEENIELKPDIAVLEQFFSSDVNPLQQQSENLETENQTLEEKPNAEMLLIESAKALLQKYTANTGIRPDLLYQCPEKICGGFFSNYTLWLKHMKVRHNSLIAKCPHCCVELAMDAFEQHLTNHCMKLYICFHCDASFVTENELRKHAAATHAEFINMKIECIPYNISWTFYIIVDEKLLTERLEFLIKLNEVFKARVQRMDALADDFANLNAVWSVADNAHWLEGLRLPNFFTQISTTECMMTSCQKHFPTQEKLLDHLFYAHNISPPQPFQCPFCSFIYQHEYKYVFNHLFLHSELIFVCGVCSYKTAYRPDMVSHICEQHNRRDVPLLLLHRSLKETKVELSFVFAAGARTFTTTKSCFCGCETTKLRLDSFISHLRREHLLKLSYFCEYCDEHLSHLQSIEAHHRDKHAELNKEFKIRCQIALSKGRMVNIAAIRPLQICFSDEIIKKHSQIGSTSILRAALTDCVPIKKENIDEDDDDIIIMEEDEIIAEDEMKLVQRTANQNCSSVKVLKINPNLFKSNF